MLKITENLLQKLRVILSWTCFVALLGFITFSIIKSIYDPLFGNTRGAIWKGNIWTFRLYSPIEMLFGQGSGMFAKNATLAYSMIFGHESEPVVYATSHDIFLQALLSNGIIGLICLLLGAFSIIRDWFKIMRFIALRPVSKYDSVNNISYDEKIRIASFTAVIGYFGTSLVESTYPHTVMLLFAMLSLYRSSFFIPRVRVNNY